MNWPYLAGLWEGEGSFSIAIRYSPRSLLWFSSRVFLRIELEEAAEGLLRKIQGFLKEEGISSSFQRKKNGNVGLLIGKLSDVERFVEKIYPHLEFDKKRREFRILKQAIAIMKSGEHLTKSGLLRLAELREELAKLRSKGQGLRYTSDFIKAVLETRGQRMPRRPWPNEVVEKVLNLRRKGLTERQIAKETGLARSTVHYFLKTRQLDGAEPKKKGREERES